MPTISTFYGICIQMFWGDHAPPHLHALYAEHEVLVDIQTFQVYQGEMPARALGLVREWMQAHQADLLENWALCQRNQAIKKILPLR